MAQKKEPDSRTEAAKRSYTMSRIRSVNTSIEVALRKALYANGVRYKINTKNLPGKPDIAITKHKIAIFCDGEFWHGYNWQERREKIKSRRDYWIPKIERTIERDAANKKLLEEMGWTVIRFWGSEINTDLDGCIKTVLSAISEKSALRAAETPACYSADEAGC
ncbi:MAG: very short patch repair endonuclease [Eubacteriaceae bacterium]|nr:very short patch repair endonuclease [Eubacteriaceae bacterium]